MGYTTEFDGSITVDPPLNRHEVEYLERFARSRRMNRGKGPYYANPGTDFGQEHEDDIKDYNYPPDGQPGLWCQWIPSADGTEIAWDQGEKFYYAEEWMVYLIDHFLRPGAAASMIGPGHAHYQPDFAHFTFDHVLNGEIFAQGEDADDRWKLVVKDNGVSVVNARIVYDDEIEEVR